MNWTDLQFKAKDLIVFSAYLITAVFFISRVTTSLERQGERLQLLQSEVAEMKNESRGSTKENTTYLQNIQNQVNLTTTQLRLLEQRVDMLEKQLSR